MADRFGPLPGEVKHLLATVVLKSLCRRANVAKIEAGPKGAVIAFRDNRFANPDGLIALIREYGRDAKVRPDMKLVLFDAWETPLERLKGTTAILRRLVKIAERKKAA
jgi:transcription-repair coupling factor (superfamily II helicase)